MNRPYVIGENTMRRKQNHAIALCAPILLLGCVTVEPRPDYERAAEHITHATGQTHVYRPGDDDVAAERVRERLADGLTAETAMELCLLNNPRLQAAFFDVGMSRADVVQSGLLANPTLGLSLRLPSGGGLANIEAALAQNIADIWQIPARSRAAERALDEAILRLAREVSTTAIEAKAAYYGAVAADRRLALARENAEIARQLVDMAAARRDAGAGSEIDVNAARSEQLETELAVRTAALDAVEARQALAVVLGLTDSPTGLVLVEDLPGPPQHAITPERLQSLALAHRLDILAARAASEAALAQWDEQRLRVFPTLEIGVELERAERQRSQGRRVAAETVRASAAAGAFTLPEIERSEPKHTDFIIGPSIGLELPIFDQNQAQIARAEYAYEQAVRLLDALTREVTQEAWLAHERARSAWETAQFYENEVLPARQAHFDMSREAYAAGRSPWLTVMEAQRALLAARAGHVDALRRAAIALTDIERVTGQPIREVLNTGEATANPRDS